MEKRMKGIEKTLNMHIEVLKAKRKQKLAIIKEEKMALKGKKGKQVLLVFYK